jgi:hypothetical protein
VIGKPATKPTKAVGGFAAAFLVALYATVQGRTDLDTMKPLDWGIVVLGSLATAGVVYFAPNRPTGT